jgi:hypothetical protein
MLTGKEILNYSRIAEKKRETLRKRQDISKYAEDVRTEPPGADEAVREVEGYHEPHDEPSSRSNTGLLVERVRSPL